MESRVSQLHTKAIVRLKAHLSGCDTRAGRDVGGSLHVGPDGEGKFAVRAHFTNAEEQQ